MQTGCSNCLCIPACTHQHFIRTYAYNAHTYICRHIRALMHTYIHVCIRMYHINTYIPGCIIFIRTRSIDSYIYAQGTSQIYIQCTCAFVCTCVHTCIDMYRYVQCIHLHGRMHCILPESLSLISVNSKSSTRRLLSFRTRTRSSTAWQRTPVWPNDSPSDDDDHIWFPATDALCSSSFAGSVTS